MARLARVVAVDVPHHVTQRGNARQVIFASDADRLTYLALLGQYSELHGLSLLGYCVMSNHVHLIAIPQSLEALARSLQHAHGRYAWYWKARQSSTGHVWQGRFYSCPLDEVHLWKALRYVELNPVRAGMTESAAQWRWSSAAAHCGAESSGAVLDMERWRKRWTAEEWRQYLTEAESASDVSAVRQCTHTGRPLGTAEFVAALEKTALRPLAPQKGGAPQETCGGPPAKRNYFCRLGRVEKNRGTSRLSPDFPWSTLSAEAFISETENFSRSAGVGTRWNAPWMRRSLVLQSFEAIGFSFFAIALLFWLQWRYGFNWADEGWLWYISQSVNSGQVPIRDVFSYDPGRYYWSATIFRLLGRDGFFEQLVANYLFATIGLALVYIAMARMGMKLGWRISALVLLAIALGYPRHKVYEQTLSLIAVAAVAFVLAHPEKRWRWFWFGAATGLAAFVGRNSGFYFVIAALLLLAFLRISQIRIQAFRSIAAFAGGVVAGYAPMFFMLAFVHGFAPAFVSSVLLTPRWSWRLPIPFPWAVHGSGLSGVIGPQIRAISWLCIAVPVSYAVTVWKNVRSRPDGTRTLALGSSLAGIPYLHHAFYHADFPHIAQGVVPFILVAGAGCSVLWTNGKTRRSMAYFAGTSLLVLACWVPMEPFVQHLRAQWNSSAETASVVMYGRSFEVSSQQAHIMNDVQSAFRRCGARDGSFFEAPFYPGLYAFLGTRAPTWDVYFLWPRSEQTQEQEVSAMTQAHTSLVLINRDASFDRQDWLKINNTNPLLAKYVSHTFEPTSAKLPDNFELDVLPGSCQLASN